MNVATRTAIPPIHALPKLRLPSGKITTVEGYDLIALGEVSPLTRPREPFLAKRRHELIARALAANSRAAQAVAGLVTRYPPSSPRSDNSVAARLQFLLEGGFVILKPRQPQASNWPYLDMPPRAAWNMPCAIPDHLSICATSNHKLTEAGARFLFILEAGWPKTAERKKSMHPYWPGGASGVTLGAGYDMGRRGAGTIASDLVQAGVDPKLAQEVGKGFQNARGKAAETALATHSNLAKTPILTEKSAWKLMLDVVGSYEHHTAWQLPRETKNRLFGYEFDALVVDAFQKWTIHGGIVGPLMFGRLDRVAFLPADGRDIAERHLFRAGQYDSAELHAA